jgi:BASS family bile acid:Na+ symporter
MTIAQLIPIVLQISVALVVFCVALHASPGDLSYLLRRPGLLVRSVLAMNVVMPIVAAVIAAVCNLRYELKIALIVLAVSPVPPILPTKEGKAGGGMSYAIGLLMFAALLALVAIPVTIVLIGRAFGRTVDLPMASIAQILAMSVVVPLIAGVIVRTISPSFGARFAKPISMIATVLILLGFVPVLIMSWPAIVARIGDFTLVAVVLFTLVGLGVGHLMGGPAEEDRTVLALSTASRHPGVALAIAGAVAEDKAAVSAAVLLAFLVGTIVTVPYVKWRQRSVGHAVAPASKAG